MVGLPRIPNVALVDVCQKPIEGDPETEAKEGGCARDRCIVSSRELFQRRKSFRIRYKSLIHEMKMIMKFR